MKTTRSVLAAAFAFGLSLSAFAGPPPSKATKAEFDKAQTLFEKAKELLQKGKIDDAMAGFNKSYGVVASPISRLFVARCLAALGRNVDAHRELSEVIAEARVEGAKDSKYQETLHAAESERAELGAHVAIVVVKVEDPAVTGDATIGGVARPKDRWAEGYAMPPGAVEVAFTSGGKREVQTVSVAVGEKREVVFAKLAAPPAVVSAPVTDDSAERRKKLRVGAYVAGAVGVVGLGVFAVEGASARSRYNDLKAECGGGPCPADRAGDVSDGRRTAKIANIGLAVGAIGVGAGVTMFVLSREPKHGETGGTRVQVAGAPGMVSIQGSFR